MFSFLRRIARHTILLSLGEAVPSLFNLFLVPLYLKYISVAELGMYATFNLITQFLIIAMTMSAPSALLKYYWFHKDDRARQKGVVSGLLLTTLGLGIVIGAIFEFAGDPIRDGLNISAATSAEMHQTVLLGLIQSFGSYLTTLSRVREKSLLVLLSAIVYCVVNLAIVLAYIGISEQLTLLDILISLTTAQAVSVAFLMFAHRSELTLRVSSRDLVAPLKFGAGITIYNVKSFLERDIDRILLTQLSSLEMLGTFFIVKRVAQFVGIVTNNASRAYVPMLLRDRMSEGKMSLKTISEVSAFIFPLLLLAFAVFAPVIVRLISTAALPYWHLSVIMAAAFVVANQMYLLNTELMHRDQTVVISIISLLPTAVSTGAGYLLVKYFGVEGAAWLMMLSAITGYLCTECYLSLSRAINARDFLKSQFYLVTLCSSVFAYVALGGAGILIPLAVAGAIALSEVIAKRRPSVLG